MKSPIIETGASSILPTGSFTHPFLSNVFSALSAFSAVNDSRQRLAASRAAEIAYLIVSAMNPERQVAAPNDPYRHSTNRT
jgi:hypothetical protein